MALYYKKEFGTSLNMPIRLLLPPVCFPYCWFLPLLCEGRFSWGWRKISRVGSVAVSPLQDSFVVFACNGLMKVNPWIHNYDPLYFVSLLGSLKNLWMSVDTGLTNDEIEWNWNFSKKIFRISSACKFHEWYLGFRQILSEILILKVNWVFDNCTKLFQMTVLETYYKKHEISCWEKHTGYSRS